MPAELERTYVQVIGLYALATVISTVQTRRAKKAGCKDAVNGAALPGDPIEVKNQAASPIAAQPARAPAEPETNKDTEEAMLKFIRENKGVSVGECMKHCSLSNNRTRYALKKLLASSAIKAEGKGKGTTYTAH